MTWYNADYVRPADDQDMFVVQKIMLESPEEYRKYIVYNERRMIGISTEIHFSVDPDLIEGLSISLQSISETLPNTFTMKEFLVFLKKNDFPLDFGQARAFVPGTGLNFSVSLFCPMLRVVGKEFIYTRAWASQHGVTA